MLNEIKDSIKARLYDMKYTLFLVSYSFFFVYFNAKLFLIFFDNKLSVQKNKEIKNISNKVSNNEKTTSLDTFFQNYSNIDKNNLKNILLDIKKMQKVTSEKAIQSLNSKRILEDNSLYVILTGFGLEIVDKLFRGNI